ncbi:hypothetical protein SJ345_03650 [Citrobacter braakii]|uniref:hypothetical protein n=1 Tax=Citrobacter braakii TaxID=57706 RepID=UPI001E3613C6|nr:hypothetical protein [Citrobacter braakii]MCD9263230.1 hypothetical protein [Citrobacter braakii]MDX7345696.1 hypothetical protein [Citrobacter braakii]
MTALNKEANPRAKLREQIESAEDAYRQFDNGWISDMKCGDLSHEYLLFVKEPKNVLALLDELEASKELVELQRFKLERQAEDLHQAKSLESIHREKRFEVEREYSDYKHRAESNSMRLAKEVCRLEDALQAAGIRIEGED